MPNRLSTETSPYLRQHRDNPVEWYPWGPAAFADAAQRDVPILLSVGYSACHWCHVMAHECFEDQEVAAFMNQRYVCVKVDREERPDVDAVYMDAVQAMNGHGGWPMTVFLTPQGHPFYGGTYYPKNGFLQLMEAISNIWLTRRQEVEQNIQALTQTIGRTATITPADDLPRDDFIDTCINKIETQFDAKYGGFGSAPKFPSTMNLDLILRRLNKTKNHNDEIVVRTSLDAMCCGGIYDHLGGGFARYSVDDKWLAPHFEKMLYDQALLVRVYTHAWQVLGESAWKQVVQETIDYVLRDLRDSRGGFYSAQDADSLDSQGHAHEGIFYTWTPGEIYAVCGDDLGAQMCDWFDVSENGNFEGRNILNRINNRPSISRESHIERGRHMMFEARSRRIYPGLDSKVILEWNALMITALVEAAMAFERQDWLLAAQDCAEFLYQSMRNGDGSWHRSWQSEGTPPARHRAIAADYACVIDAFTRLGESTGHSQWIIRACKVADDFVENFHDPMHGGFFTVAANAEQLVVRQKDLMDNATPAANSTAAVALIRLGTLMCRTDFIDIGQTTLRLLMRIMVNAPSAAGQSLSCLDMLNDGLTQIVIAGDNGELHRVIDRTWLPHAVIARGEPYNSPLWNSRQPGLAYVCQNYSCQAPTKDPNTLRQLLSATIVTAK